jgi:hypothetical protein
MNFTTSSLDDDEIPLLTIDKIRQDLNRKRRYNKRRRLEIPFVKKKLMRIHGSKDLEINIVSGCTEYILYITKASIVSFVFNQFLIKYKHSSIPVIKEHLSKALFDLFIQDKNVIYMGFDSERQCFIGLNIVNLMTYINFKIKDSNKNCGMNSKIIKVCITNELKSQYYASIQPMWKKNNQWRLYSPCNINWWHYKPIYSNDFYCLDIPYENENNIETYFVDHHKNIRAYKDVKKIIRDYESNSKEKDGGEWDFVSDY